MKKALLLLIFLVLALSLSARTQLINFSYTVNGSFLGRNGSAQSAGLSFTNLYTDGEGFYTRFNPYYGLNLSVDDANAYFAANNEFLLGCNAIFGYAKDFDMNNKMGVIFGGGVLFNTFLLYYDESTTTIGPVLNINNSVFHLALGLGISGNFYIHPGDGDFVINTGIMMAWSPLYLFEDALMNFRANQVNLDIAIGVGWHY